MDRFPADYFDGQSSQRRPVEVVVTNGRATIAGADVILEYAVAELAVQPRIGSTPFRITLPGGGILVTQADIGSVLRIPRPEGLAHLLESRLRYVFAAFVGLIATGALGYMYGIPWLAREVAYRIPPQVEADIAVEGLKELDRFILKPTKLTRERQEALRSTFAELAEGAIPAHLEFREGSFIGANAFALPGGVVVMTDQLEEVLQEDGRIAAVLAHEIGHLEHRHGARHILQDSITALIAAAVLGDVSSIGGLVATLPALVMHTANSRDFEREADAYAFALLRKTGRSPRLLGDALAAIEKAQEEQEAAMGDCKVALDDPPPGHEGDPAPRSERRNRDLGYLSTHPPTQERIRASEEAAR
jgi:Zn-dependent protease with chaperone function